MKRNFLLKVVLIVSFFFIFPFRVSSVQSRNTSYLLPIDTTTSFIKLSSYVTPTILYKNQSNQPVVFVVTDEDNNYVTDATFTVKYSDGTQAKFKSKEICAGFYKIFVDTSNVNQPSIEFFATKGNGSNSIRSNVITISLINKGMFNPYVDIDAIFSRKPYGKGSTMYDSELARIVFDKLPCSVGNAFELNINYWQVADPSNWHIHKVDTLVNGPVRKVGKNRYICERPGEIRVSIQMVIWERINTNCQSWDKRISDEEMSINARTHTYNKTFEISAVNSCETTEISLESGSQIDATAIEVKKSADLFFSVNSMGAPSDLECSCFSLIAHIYMTKTYTDNGKTFCKKLPDAFTFSTSGGDKKTINEIWLNPNNVLGTNIKDIPITFGNTDKSLQVVYEGFGVLFKNLAINYVNNSDTNCHLVIQIFGKKTIHDSSGAEVVTYPLIFEGVDGITVIPKVIELKSTVMIDESGANSILAGTFPTIEISNPGFTSDNPTWRLLFNGKIIGCNVSSNDFGYQITFSCPLNDKGTLQICGFVYNAKYTQKEEMTIKIPVVKPEFTVQIGLSDGSVIDNDGIITEGIPEQIYVIPTDPRGIHDFSTDSDWTLEAKARYNENNLPTSIVCYKIPDGGNASSPIQVVALHNPSVSDKPKVDIYFVEHGCARIYVDTLEIVPPTMDVKPKTAPFTVPETATPMTVSIIDAHGHGASGINIKMSDGTNNPMDIGMTGSNGTIDWMFKPTHSGLYKIYMSNSCVVEKNLVCDWPRENFYVTVEAVKKKSSDTTPPTITVTYPKSSTTVGTKRIDIKGNATDNIGVYKLFVNAKEITLSPDGSFSCTVSLVEGTNTITIVAVDKAGNKTTETITVMYNPKMVIVLKIGDPYMYVNGEKEEIDPGRGTTPIIKNNRTLVPIRAIVEALGGTIQWNPNTKAVTIILNSTTIVLQIDNSFACVNGSQKQIDPSNSEVVPIIVNGRTMLPLRFVAENLGCKVSWDNASRTIIITYES